MLGRLGGILPKTITQQPRPGNPPPRTFETTGGMLNSIGLDNDGIEGLHRTAVALSGLAGHGDHRQHRRQRTTRSSCKWPPGSTACRASRRLELNISCPNVSGGVDFGTDPAACEKVVCRRAGGMLLPILAKLTPNVTDIAAIARAAEAGGADALSLINTCLGMAVNWRQRRPMLGNVLGGLSGPAIKPIALRIVYQVAQAVKIPLVGIGGIATIDDVMEFLVTGATAVQIGTANFYNPTVSMQILDALPARPGRTRRKLRRRRGGNTQI